MEDANDIKESHKEQFPKRVLLVSGRTLTHYVVQGFLKIIIENAPKDQYQWTWYFPGVEDKTYANEIRALGVDVIAGGHILNGARNLVQYGWILDDLKSVFNRTCFDNIHINIGNRVLSLAFLLSSFLNRVPKRIVHSYNSISWGSFHRHRRSQHTRIFREKEPIGIAVPKQLTRGTNIC